MTTQVTTTEHWLLEKYSRSTQVQPRPGTQPSAAATQIDWQHFTDKQLHLHLETTTQSQSSHPRQARTTAMRLLFSFAPGAAPTSAPEQRIPLDSVDLVALSQPFATQSAETPIKAVHRLSVVGLRFVDLANNNNNGHGPSSTPPPYKRIQIKFQTTEAAQSFLRAIEIYCPAAPAQVKQQPAPAPPDPQRFQHHAGEPPTSEINTNSSLRGSSIMPPSPSPPPPLPPPLPTRTATVLPASFATLFPNLAATKRRLEQPEPEEEEEEKESASRTLVSLTDEELESVVLQVLGEDGFGDLVEKVKSVVYGQETR